jgi:hypothetical protein
MNPLSCATCSHEDDDVQRFKVTKSKCLSVMNDENERLIELNDEDEGLIKPLEAMSHVQFAKFA